LALKARALWYRKEGRKEGYRIHQYMKITGFTGNKNAKGEI
jgi:hypothetical protein